MSRADNQNAVGSRTSRIKGKAGQNVSYHLSYHEVETLRHRLRSLGIEPTKPNVSKLAGIALRKLKSITDEEIHEVFVDALLAPYQEQIEHILEVSRQVASIKAASYGKTTTKYDDPVRIKLLREIDEFGDVLREYHEGVIHPSTGQPTDSKDVRLELADIAYYNTQDHQQEPDARSWLVVMERYSEQAGVSVSQALDDCIAKYTCRVAHPTLKPQDKQAAYLLERDALADL